MKKEKAWVWFKGGEQGGHWVGGFIASNSPEGGILIERQDFVSCRVPEWRISLTAPKDETVCPDIPEGTIWKYI